MKRHLLFALLAFLFAACSGSGEQPTPLPTSTMIPTYNYVSPTPVAVVETAIATQAAPQTANDQTIARGRDRYEVLECGSCHGANGEGSDDGSPLVEIELSEDDFITFLRTGGTIGTDHQYATNRLSAGGAHNLYEYLKSLSA